MVVNLLTGMWQVRPNALRLHVLGLPLKQTYDIAVVIFEGCTQPSSPRTPALRSLR